MNMNTDPATPQNVSIRFLWGNEGRAEMADKWIVAEAYPHTFGRFVMTFLNRRTGAERYVTVRLGDTALLIADGDSYGEKQEPEPIVDDTPLTTADIKKRLKWLERYCHDHSFRELGIHSQVAGRPLRRDSPTL